MLAQKYPPEKIAEVLIPRAAWHPFPTAAERAPWESLPASVRQALVEQGEQALAAPWPELRATQWLEYARTGNRSRCEAASFGRRRLLCDWVLAECVEGQGRFADAIADAVWSICEESYWGVPAHLNMQRAGPGLPDVAEPTVDLFVGETIGLLAWTLYLVGERLDQVSPLMRQRLYLEAERRVFFPCLERQDFWWMGFAGRAVNNWNPWCNSNWLTAVLLLERDETRRLRAVSRILSSLDRFIDSYPADGGCDEGPGYWGRAGASLFDCLELLHSATGGAIDVYGEPLVKEIGRYIYRAHIAGRYFLNFADAPARVSLSAALVYRYGRRISDPQMQALGAWAARDQDLLNRGGTDSIGRQLPSLFVLQEIFAQEEFSPPLPRHAWLPHIQVFAARDQEGAEQGLYVAAKGGHNGESHNHNDVGHFVVYNDGLPIIVDAGVGEYTAKTFSARRYEIWTMQSAYHSLPTIGGIQQQPGKEFAAKEVSCQVDEETVHFRLDLAAAYPPEAHLRAWRRIVLLRRGQVVEVKDEYALSQQVPEIALSLLTPCRAEIGHGQILLEHAQLTEGRRSGRARLTFPADKLTALSEEIPLEDDRLRSVWGPRLTRLLLRAIDPPEKGAWTLRIAPV